jgi:Tfp pilus assembly protein PilN
MSTINLLPDDYLTRRARRRANVLCLALFGAVMIGIVSAYLASEQSFRHTLEVRDRVEKAYAEAARLIRQMQQLEVQKRRLLEKAERTSSLQERVPRSYLLGVIANECPPYTSLARVSLNLHRVATARRSPGGSAKHAAAARHSAQPSCSVRLTLSGLASTDVQVARLIANLARNPLLRSVDLVYSKEKLVDKRVRVREFQITLDLEPHVDVLDVIERAGAPAGPSAEVSS